MEEDEFVTIIKEMLISLHLKFFEDLMNYGAIQETSLEGFGEESKECIRKILTETYHSLDAQWIPNDSILKEYEECQKRIGNWFPARIGSELDQFYTEGGAVAGVGFGFNNA